MRNAKPVFDSDDHSLYEEFQFSPAVKAGPFVFLSGVIGTNAEFGACATAAEEYEAAFQAIERILAAAGATLADVVTLETFHVTDDMATAIAEFKAVRARWMKAPHPTWTAIGVAKLGIPGARVEVKVTAYLPGNGDRK